MGNDSSKTIKIDGAAPIIVNAKSNHTATIFFFHGLGDQEHRWAQVFREDIVLPHVKIVFPNAAVRPTTLTVGFPIPAWFDVVGLYDISFEDTVGIQRAAEYVHDLINAEINAGIPSERIVLAGYSMGGAVALYSGLTFDKPLAAIVGLSTFLPQRDKIPGNHTANIKTPIFLGHGTQDALVQCGSARKTYEAISKFNSNVQFQTYPMGHTHCADELKDVKEFLENVLE